MFEIQVLVTERGQKQFASVKPSNGEPYRYPTKEKAFESLNKFYYLTPDKCRVIKPSTGETYYGQD